MRIGRTRTIIRRGILPGALMVAGALLAACGGSPSAVVVAPAAAGYLILHPAGTGVVSPGIDLPVVVGYEGTVTHVDVVLGQHVTAGQPLLGIDSETLSDAADQLASHLALDQATLRTVQNQGRSSTDRVAALAGQVALDRRLLDAAQGKTAELRAPIAGFVGAVDATPGGVFKASQSLVEIIDASTVSVTFPVPVAYFGEVQLGMPASLTGLGSAGAQLPATVAGVAPQTLADGQSFSVVVNASNTSGLAQPGRPTLVRLNLTTNVTVAVNRLSVLNLNTQPQVFVISDGVAHQRSVVVGLQDDSHVQILSGVTAGENVVIAGAQSLTDGTQVRVTQSITGT